MSDQVQVEITGMVITARYGSLETGTVLRTDHAFAKHLVEECGAAKWIDAPVDAPVDSPVEVAPVKKPRAKG